jgi:hypothetical protein
MHRALWPTLPELLTPVAGKRIAQLPFCHTTPLHLVEFLLRCVLRLRPHCGLTRTAHTMRRRLHRHMPISYSTQHLFRKKDIEIGSKLANISADLSDLAKASVLHRNRVYMNTTFQTTRETSYMLSSSLSRADLTG